MQDHNPHFAEAARALVTGSPHPALRQAQITTAVSGDRRFDLVVAAHVFSEISLSRIAEFVSRPWCACRGIYVAATRDGVVLTPSAPRVIAPVVSTKAGSRFRLCTENGISDVDIPRRNAAEYRRHRRKNWGDVF